MQKISLAKFVVGKCQCQKLSESQLSFLKYRHFKLRTTTFPTT